ncbi:hypothetical protein DL764_006970 [Monosporascus ibericus]|uniref:Uncharacterized protein n=1 Tax=Monosporascus ibericus TaxID=155417 RepID=A0A4Q4T3P5_9PEZI|nr:hypothetical protein DL764_006970 [Monosporascus ibericus]
MQQTLLSKMEEIKEGLHLVADVRGKVVELVQAMGDVSNKMGELQGAVDQCQNKIEESGEKLETVRTGLADFASDVNSWIHFADGSEADDGTERNGQPPSATVALGTPGSQGEEVDLLRYVEGQSVSFAFEPRPPKEEQRPFALPSSDSPSSSPSPPSVASPSKSSSLSPQSFVSSSSKMKGSLSTKIQELEDENDHLRARVSELEAHINSLQRKHAAEIATRSTLLRQENVQYKLQINRQNELIADIVQKVYGIFSDYKEELNIQASLFERIMGFLKTSMLAVGAYMLTKFIMITTTEIGRLHLRNAIVPRNRMDDLRGGAAGTATIHSKFTMGYRQGGRSTQGWA